VALVQIIAIGFWEPNARRKGGPYGIEPILQRCQLSHNRIRFLFQFGWWAASN